jgi:uncharacterized membrane protein YbhN (UPF0104 family)
MRSGLARARRRWGSLAVTLAAAALACVLLRRSLPDPGAALRALTAARWWWLGLAAVLQGGSIMMYAVQQRRLLAALGGAMSLGGAVGLSLARATLSTALPAGGPVSTAFAVRHFRACGATGPAALAVAALASVQASAAAVLLYAGWCAAAGLARMTTAGPPGRAAAVPVAVAAAAALCVAAAAAVLRRVLPRAIRPGTRAGPGRDGIRGALAGWGRRAVHLGADTTRACGSLSRRDWLAAGGAAVARRLLDLACLAAVAVAYRLDAGITALVGAYLAGLLVRQVPLVGGGAGLVEASLLASLVVAGAGGATAAAVVLAYRLLSCWLVALAGVPALLIGARDRPAGLARSPRGATPSGTVLGTKSAA